MNYLVAHSKEGKLVRCTMGEIHDVAIFLCSDSSTYMESLSGEAAAEIRQMPYLSKGLARRFLILEDNSEVFCQMPEIHHRDSARGIGWNNPGKGFLCLSSPTVVSRRELSYQDFTQ